MTRKLGTFNPEYAQLLTDDQISNIKCAIESPNSPFDPNDKLRSLLEDAWVEIHSSRVMLKLANEEIELLRSEVGRLQG